MALTTYELDLSWFPDGVYINAAVDGHYLAWRIGVNRSINTGVWIIEPLVAEPEPLENLLPVAQVERSLTTDVTSFGHERTGFPNDTISEVQAKFTEALAVYEVEVE